MAKVSGFITLHFETKFDVYIDEYSTEEIDKVLDQLRKQLLKNTDSFWLDVDEIDDIKIE